MTCRALVFGTLFFSAAWSFARPVLGGDVEIRSPRNGAALSGPTVTVSGTSDADAVKVTIWRGPQQVFSGRAVVEHGRWSVTKNLGQGEFQFVAETPTMTRKVTFSVREGFEAQQGLRIDSPRTGANLSGPNVEIRGSGDSGTVTVKVYQGAKLVYTGKPGVRNGRWSVSPRLSDGPHRVVVEQGRLSRSSEFVVRTGGGQQDNVSISVPHNGATLAGPRVSVSGTANTPSVSVYVYQGNKRVFESSTSVNRGKWAFSLNLADGSYRAEIKAGSRQDTVNFKVGANSGGGNDNVDVAVPRNGATVTGPRVSMSGTANTRTVSVYVYQGNKQVFESSTSVKNGKWAFTLTLKNGNYRAEIKAGTKQDTVNFKVKH